MSKFHSYLNTASGIIKNYGGDLPLSIFLKDFFSTNKKYGSKDRKQIANICYCYFRLGKALPTIIPEEDILKQYLLTGLFVCADKPDKILEDLASTWNNNTHLTIDEKFSFLKGDGISLNIATVFPWSASLSGGIDYQEFCKSFFLQPALFLRVRPGYTSIVKEKLSNAQVNFSVIDENTMVLPNLTKLDEIVFVDKEVVIQDYSSQRVAAFFKPVKEGYPHSLKVWDCCAASGGKSILAKDFFESIELTVSDIRDTILKNLQLRFNRAGIIKYKSFVADLTQSKIAADKDGYDLIICDAPCSGSGTWSRTPEQLHFWDEEDINHYTNLQRSITSNIISLVKPGGYLLYITCSVFKKENEDIVNEILNPPKFKLIQMQVIKGYDVKADTMFAALLQKGNN